MFTRIARRGLVTARVLRRNLSTTTLKQGKTAFRTLGFGVAGAAAASMLFSMQNSNTVGGVAHAAGSSAASAKVPHEGIAGTNQERTFIAIKPDGVQRGLIGKIIQQFEAKGFKLVAMKLIVPSQAQAAGHYDDLKTKPFFNGLVKFFSSGPVVAMVWEGKSAIKTGRVLLGTTNPAESAPGTIRGDFAVDIGRNVCHGSDGPEGAAREIKFWFKEEEMANWSSDIAQWVYEKL